MGVPQSARTSVPQPPRTLAPQHPASPASPTVEVPWTLWTYDLFGGGAPTASPGTVFSSVDFDVDLGTWDLVAHFTGSQFDTDANQVVWQAPVNTVHPELADGGYGALVEVEVTGKPTRTSRSAQVHAGPAAYSVRSLSGGTYDGGFLTCNDTAQALTANASVVGARVVVVGLPGSVTSIPGPMFVFPRGAGGSSLAAAKIDNTSGGNEAAFFVGPSFGKHAAGDEGADVDNGPVRFESRAYPVPAAPWDGGEVWNGTGDPTGKWILLTYDGSDPDTDILAGFVASSGVAGNTWQFQWNATQASSNQGWFNTTGAGLGRAQWVPDLSGIANETVRARLAAPREAIAVAVRAEAGWDTGGRQFLGAGIRPAGGSTGYVAGLGRNSATGPRASCLSSNAQANSGAGAGFVGAVGVVIADLPPDGGNWRPGGASCNPYTSTGPQGTTGQSVVADSSALANTVDTELFVAYAEQAVGANATQQFEASLWVCLLGSRTDAAPGV